MGGRIRESAHSICSKKDATAGGSAKPAIGVRGKIADPPLLLLPGPLHLRIRALGGFEVEREGKLIQFPRKAQRKPLLMLKMLIALGGKGRVAISRGAGEVAPILFTGAAYFLSDLPNSLSDQFMSLGYHIYIMSTQSSDVDATLPIQFATTLVLLLLTFSLNAVAVVLRYRIRRGAK